MINIIANATSSVDKEYSQKFNFSMQCPESSEEDLKVGDVLDLFHQGCKSFVDYRITCIHSYDLESRTYVLDLVTDY